MCCTTPGERLDRLGLVDALADEQRCHQVVDANVVLGDQRAASPAIVGAGAGVTTGAVGRHVIGQPNGRLHFEPVPGTPEHGVGAPVPDGHRADR